MRAVIAFLAFLAPLIQATGKPNIILFLVDDMGWMDSTPYGSKYYETPNMDKFARQSMLFTDAYAHPLCSPTRASILSGQYPSRHGITTASGHKPARPAGQSRYPKGAPGNKPFLYAVSRNYLDPALVTLPEVLAKAGYSTGHFGKWHLGLAREHWPEKHGFQVAFHAQPSPGPPGGHYFSPYGVQLNAEPSPRSPGGTITDGPKGEYVTDRLTEESIAFIEANKDKPFYLNLWHYGVHGPWGHKEEYTAEFARKTDPRGEQRNPIMASMLKSIDESLGRVLAKLDELDLTRNTIFIFYSDNGGNVHSNAADDHKIARIKPGHPRYPQLEDWRKWAGPEPPTNNAPLREGKARIYEGGQRVPLMVRWPGRIEPGSASDAVVAAIDLYPTLLDALEIPKPKGHLIDGESILPVLEGKGSIKRKAYFTWFPHLVGAVSVRQGNYKLIRRFESHARYPETVELYNLKDDIGETRNLVGKMPMKVRGLQALIDGFVKETGALYPKANPNYDPDWKPAASKPRPQLSTPQLREVIVSHTDDNDVLQLFRMKEDGSGRLQLTHSERGCRMPACSPNGEKLVYVQLVNHSLSLWLSDIEGKNPRALVSEGMNLVPSWLPDSRQIVWMKAQQGKKNQDPASNSQIHILDTETGKSRRLFSDPEQIKFSNAMPSASPDGKKIAFVSNRGGPFRIWVSNLDGSDAKLISPPPKEQDENLKLPIEQKVPTWSPDGKWIAHWEGVEMIHMSPYTGIKNPKRDQQISATFNVWVASSNGKQRRKVGRGDDPTWSPDGFVSRAFPDQERGGPKIMIETRSGEKELPIVPPRTNWGRFSWLPDPAYKPNAKPTTSKPRPQRPTPEQFFQRRDANKDGSITLKEYIGNPKGRNVSALTQNFNRRDANKDGKLTLAELKRTK